MAKKPTSGKKDDSKDEPITPENIEETVEELEGREEFDSETGEKTSDVSDVSGEKDDTLSSNEEISESADKDRAEEARDTRPKGHLLKEARERQGMSLDNVHEATKIPLDALRAIEEGYSIRTLSPFYVRGFLKIYAKYLNLDPNDFVEDEPKIHVRKPKSPPPAPPLQLPKINVQRWMQDLLTPKRRRQLFIACGIILATFLFLKFVSFLSNIKPKKVEVRKITPAERVTSVPANVPAAVQSTPPAQPAASPAPAVAPAVQSSVKKVRLTVRAQRDSWLRVSVDGQIVFQSTLAKGAVEVWEADDQITITGRNINRLEFELNGKMIGTLGRKDRNAESVIISKDGLRVIE